MSYIQHIDFIRLKNWSVKHLLETTASYKDGFELVKIGSFLKRNKTPIDIEDDKTYKRVTIRLYNKGVLLRDTEVGKNIGTKKQFIIKEGQFLLSKIDARNGAFGLATNGVDGAIITADFFAYDIDSSKIVPEYLVLTTTTKHFLKFAQGCSRGTTGRQRIDENEFLNVTIPLPSLEKQKEIVSAYQSKIILADEQERKAEELEKQIEKYLFDTLDIETSKAIANNGTCMMRFVDFANINIWSVNDLSNTKKDILNSTSYAMHKLEDILKINPTVSFKNDNAATEISFVPMECISDEYGEITKQYAGSVQKSKGYTKFQENDLLWSKITPCMQNGKTAIARNLTNKQGYGSTEYYVLRSENDNVSIDFIHELLRLDIVLNTAMQYFTGSAGQQRVPKEFLANLKIPLPEIEIQNEIVSHVEQMKNEIKALKASAIKNRESAITDFESEIFDAVGNSYES